MTAFDLVVFDLDGTLVESGPEIAAAVNAALRRFELPEVPPTLLETWIGHGTQQLLAQALAYITGFEPALARHSALLAQLLPVYNLSYQSCCGQHSRLYPQVLPTLDALRQQGVKLALLSNKESRYTQPLLAAHDLSRRLDLVISGDTLSHQKPNPAGLQYILAQFGVAQQRALMVGDSSIDAACARAAGVAVWLLDYGYNMGQPLSACQPDRIIHDVSVLLQS